MTHKSPTVDAEGNFKYNDGSNWKPYIWRKGEISDFSGRVHDRDAPDHGRMVCELLMNEVLFCNSRHYMEDSYSPPRTPDMSPDATIVCFVICNDIFAWACSDAECVSLSELPSLYNMWKANPAWGAVQWCILKRKQRPQPPVLRDMQAAGAWTDELEQIK